MIEESQLNKLEDPRSYRSSKDQDFAVFSEYLGASIVVLGVRQCEI